MPEDVPREEKPIPPTFDAEKVEAIIEELHQGKTLTSICKKEGVKIGSFLRWVKDDVAGLSERYARARQIGWEVMADEIIDISDDSSRDDKVLNGSDGDERIVCNSEWVQRTKIRADNRKWVISKRVPDYSDRPKAEGGEESIAALKLAFASLIGSLPD